MISNPNTTSVVANWQSVAHAEMQETAFQMDQNPVDVSPVARAHGHASDAPRFFAWSKAAEGREVEKKVLTFDHVHSEYRDCYVGKQPYQQVQYQCFL